LRRAFCEAVYAVVWDTLWKVARSAKFQILRTTQEQEDAIHAALVRTFRTALQLCQTGAIRWAESNESLSGYFNTIAKRDLGKERKKIWDRLNQRTVTRDGEGTATPDPEDPAGDDATAETDLEDALKTLVRDEIDLILILLRSEEVPYEEIVKRLKTEKGCEFTVAALRQRFARAKHDLQAKLSDQGF
jgi:DNA-directed RNA polymerase specialized sigma24 family protein